MIIRLIDIVLTVLFGFICIAQIERKSTVRLPESETSAPSRPRLGEVANVTVVYDAGEDRADASSPRRYLVSLAQGAETVVAGEGALAVELARLATESEGLQRESGQAVVPLRVNVRVDREDRVASLYDATDAVFDAGLENRIVVRVPALEDEPRGGTRP